MSSDVVETWVRNGHTVTLFHDEDCDSPRETDALAGLFLGFPHRHYRIGDERLRPDERYPCPDCAGEGWEACDYCGGAGEREPRDGAELVVMLKAKYRARVVLPVGMIDHSGVSYYVGGGAHWADPGGWDSGTCGFILDTPERLQLAFGDAEVSDEKVTEALTAEIVEYDRWARGDCYGYVITDANGEQVDSCWGFIGYDWAVEAANDAADEQEPTKTVKVTVSLHITVDRARWAELYGVDSAAVPAAVTAFYTAAELRPRLQDRFAPAGVLSGLTVAVPGQERSTG